VNGVGFLQVFGPIGFVDNVTGNSRGTQYTYAVDSDSAITTETVASPSRRGRGPAGRC
jgi:hypothetical protein